MHLELQAEVDTHRLIPSRSEARFKLELSSPEHRMTGCAPIINPWSVSESRLIVHADPARLRETGHYTGFYCRVSNRNTWVLLYDRVLTYYLDE